MGGQIKRFPTWKKILYIPVAIWNCGRSGFTQYRNPPNEEDKRRYSNLAGWLGPEMEQHWDRFLHPKDKELYDSWFDSVKNLGAEWSRLDPQRSVKILSMLILFTFGIGLLLFLAGLGIGWWLL